MRIRLTSLLIALVTVLGLGVGLARATTGESVTVLTPPAAVNAPVYWDLNGDKHDDPNELVGYFDAYSADKPIDFSWLRDAYEQVDLDHTAYRVSLRQFYPTPEEIAANGGALPAWQNWTHFYELKVENHFATNPNGPKFTMGAFGFNENLCLNCPSRFFVYPESFTLQADANGTYQYTYTMLDGAALLTLPGANLETTSGNQMSPAFVLQSLRPGPEPPETPGKDKACVPTGDRRCDCGAATDYQWICTDSCGVSTPTGETCPKPPA